MSTLGALLPPLPLEPWRTLEKYICLCLLGEIVKAGALKGAPDLLVLISMIINGRKGHKEGWAERVWQKGTRATARACGRSAGRACGRVAGDVGGACCVERTD